jgi:chaperonin GroES
MAVATKEKKSKGATKLQPLGDRVVVQREEAEEKTSGGILLPSTAQNKPARGTVISVGEGRLLDNGQRHELQIKVGDRVLFTSYAGDEFKIDGEEYLLMREDDILAVIEG